MLTSKPGPLGQSTIPCFFSGIRDYRLCYNQKYPCRTYIVIQETSVTSRYARSARTSLSFSSPEVAAEIYVASMLAIDVDTADEKSYLAMLAARLKLPPELVTELNRQVESQANADS